MVKHFITYTTKSKTIHNKGHSYFAKKDTQFRVLDKISLIHEIRRSLIHKFLKVILKNLTNAQPTDNYRTSCYCNRTHQNCNSHCNFGNREHCSDTCNFSDPSDQMRSRHDLPSPPHSTRQPHWSAPPVQSNTSRYAIMSEIYCL